LGSPLDKGKLEGDLVRGDFKIHPNPLFKREGIKEEKRNKKKHIKDIANFGRTHSNKGRKKWIEDILLI